MRLSAPFQPTNQDRRTALFTDVLPLTAYVVLVLYTGLIRMGPLPEVGVVATDKLLHALVFGGLALIALRATRTLFPRLSLQQRFFLAFFTSSFAGAVLEILQWFTTYRSADVLDWLADTVGAVLLLGLCALIFVWEARRARGS